MTSRRGFLASLLALGAAPAVVRADSLMKIVTRPQNCIWVSDIGWVSWEDSQGEIRISPAEQLEQIHYWYVDGVLQPERGPTFIIKPEHAHREILQVQMLSTGGWASAPNLERRIS